MPASSLQEHFETAGEKTKKAMEAQAKLCKFTGHPERSKTAQAEALAETYRKQLRTVIAIFCLVKNANRHGEWDSENRKWQANLQKLAQGSNLAGIEIALAFRQLDEEAAISKLRGMMSDLHTNCNLIAEQMGVEFNEKERGIN